MNTLKKLAILYCIFLFIRCQTTQLAVYNADENFQRKKGEGPVRVYNFTASGKTFQFIELKTDTSIEMFEVLEAKSDNKEIVSTTKTILQSALILAAK